MTQSQVKAIQKALRDTRKDVGKDPQKALALLVKAGIATKKRQLAKMYK